MNCLTHRYQEGTIFCNWLLIFLIKVQALSNYQYKPFSADILLEKSEDMKEINHYFNMAIKRNSMTFQVNDQF